MSVIQKIQEKYAKLMAIIIAVALMIFVVMLAFENGGSLFKGGNSTTVGRVNGHAIEYIDFSKKVQQQEKNMEARGYGSGSAIQQQAMDAAWNDEVNTVIEESELDKLGIKVGKKEMGDILYGPNGPADLKKLFTDTATGVYNGQLAKQQIDAAIKIKKGTPQQIEQRDQLIAFINFQQDQRLRDKYISLLANSVNYPKWFVEKQIADKGQLAKMAFVRQPYAGSGLDSGIVISDKEIMDYFDNHKKDYKQQTIESRSIAFVSFSTKPSAADSASVRDKVEGLKSGFDSAKNISNFLAAQGVNNFYDSYLGGKDIQIGVKDSIFKLPVGSIYGPYIDGGSYTIAKLLGKRQQADTVKVRHILIATAQRDPQSGEMVPTRDSAVAKKLIDSIQTAIAKGSNFDTLCIKFSEDPGKNDQQTGKFNGGVYDKVTSGRMVAEFNDFVFGHPAGTKGVIKTDYGYHYIEILSTKGSTEAYKIAYLPKAIESSTETEINANNDANQFAANSRDQKSFDANADKLQKERGFGKNVASDITPMSYQVSGLGQSRALVKAVFKADLGEVIEPEKAGDAYVVAIVTEINEEGKITIARARPLIEPLLKNKKTAERIKQKIGNITTLEAAVAALGGKQPIETIDSLRMIGAQTRTTMSTGITNEPRIIGAAFNPANKGKVVNQALEGANGIYVIRVDDVSATSVAEANIADERKNRYQTDKQQVQYGSRSPIEILRAAATIKDRRVNFY
jgi:peptidyl-prolyl cis-trans isomerase D